MSRIKDNKTELVATIIGKQRFHKPGKILVVGCGAGVEAAILARCLDAEVIGIDILEDFDPDSARQVTLQKGDARAMPFNDNTFDFVYSYHALEHIPDPELALKEIQRVLKIGGGYWIGTPNRQRLFGYIGSKDASIKEKFQWNCIDWNARIKGKFRNEYGAHAGYTAKELGTMLQGVFSKTDNISSIYYHEIYKKYKVILRVLELTKLSVIAYPSVYFMGRK